MLEYGITGIGYFGLVLILIGLFVEKRTQKILFPIGAMLLAVSAIYPKINWVFLACQLTASLAGWLVLFEVEKYTKITIIAFGTLFGLTLAGARQAGWDTFVGIAGLFAIAIGFASSSENPARQNMALGIGGLLMVAYSSYRLATGDIQALPWILLNIPFAAVAFWRYHKATLASA